jgi:hypothetical protein
VCLKDEGQYLALIFTHDPAFDPNGLHIVDIEYNRVIYMLGRKKYNYESSAIIAYFKNIYKKELAGTRVIHNGRNLFKINSEFILTDGADRLEILPSTTHGELSPLDNKINAIAKNQW